MAKTIALNIKIQTQGGEKVIKNINELESEIQSLQEELKGLDFGSKEFEQASKNLGTLKAGLRDVDKQIEGVDREQTIQAFGAAINGVTGAFLIASSAARTFGAEAETVESIQRAEAAALEAVNIALGVQALSEAFVQKEKIKTTALKIKDAVATKAAAAAQAIYTAVVGTSTGALKAFRIALVSTGIGAIVVGIGLLIANWEKLTGAIFGSVKAQDDFNKVNAEALKNLGTQLVDLDFYGRVVNDVTASEYERLTALEKLNEAGVISDDINLDNVESLDLLNERLEKVRANILLKAQAEAAAALLAEAMKAQIEAQNSSLEDNISWWEQSINFLLSTGNVWTKTILDAQDAAENLGERIEETGAEVERYENLYLQLLSKLNESEAELNKGRKESETRINRNNKAKQARNDADAKYLKLLEDLNKQIGEYANKLSEIEFSEEASAKIIEDANKLLEQQNELLAERAKLLDEQVGVNDEYTQSLRRLVGGIIIPGSVTQSILGLEDKFSKVVNKVIEYGSKIEESNSNMQLLGDSTENLIYYLTDVSDEFGQLNNEQKSQIISLLKSQEAAKSILDDFNTATETYNKNLKKGEEAKKLANLQDLEVFKLIVKTNEELTNRIENFKTEEEIRREIEQDVAQQLFNTRELATLSAEQLKVIEETTNLIYDQATFYGDVLKVAKELDGVVQQIGGNIVEQAGELTDSEFANLFQKIKDDAEANLPALEKFFGTLSAETSNLTQEQLDNINTFLKTFRENLDNEWAQMDWKGKVIEVINTISDLTGRIQSIVQAQISLQLEQLDYYQKQTLAIIGDETEAQREKQLQLQQEINERRFELEKKARIQELNFAVATAVAGGAQAVINALASPIPPPGPQILAGLYAGLTAVEIATIKDQLNFVKSTQFIARRGGLVSGPSHEMGGVMANGGLVLEGGEFVVNRNAVSQYSDILSSINTSTGGRALGVDDSRIVQEIRKQNQKPIKTYVMYEDIKNTNKINSKLEEISRL